MLRFDRFVLDVDGRRLLRDGEQVPLEPQAFDVLVYLVAHRERAVSKEEVFDQVWGDRWVSVSALTTRIKEIRRAVGDSGSTQGVIRTVRGHGYQFVAQLEDPAPRPHEPSGPSLVGRDRDLDELATRLLPGAAVTLVGPGGVGKTTLGRSLASREADGFRDGLLSIDLTVIRDRAELDAVIARTAQIVDSRHGNLAQLLRHLDALLVLDDADELVQDVADLCTSVTGEGSRLTVLVTCRERLGVPDEQIWPVLPLTPDGSEGLLRARARQLAPLGSLADADPVAVAQLAASVDHLPLALEMLASASAHLGLAELNDLVTSHPAMLTDPRRHGPSRHRSLEVLIDDSIDRLAPASRQVLSLVAMFPGPFRLADAAVLVHPVAPDALGALRDLVDRSLLAPAAIGRRGSAFQMLRTVTRAVRHRTDAETIADLQHRHAVWVADEARRADDLLRSTEERRGSDRFIELSDDLRVAHTWARANDVPLALELTAALHLYSHSRGWAEPAEWAQEIPQWREHGPAVAAAASQASQERRFHEAFELASLVHDHPDQRVRAWGLEVLSDIAIYQGDLDRARITADQLVALGVREADPRTLALGTTNAALARAYAHDFDDAFAVLDAYPGDGPEAVAPTDRAWLEYTWGESLATGGRTAEALPRLEAALEHAVLADSRFVAGVAEASIAGIQLANGDLDAAVRTHRDLVNTFRRHGIITHLTITLRDTARLLSALGQDREALTLCGWLLGPNGHPGYGRDQTALLKVQSEIRARHEDLVSDAWERQGVVMTPPDIADLVARALARR